MDPPGRSLGQPLARPRRRRRPEANPARRLRLHARCVRPTGSRVCAPGGERQHVAPPRPPHLGWKARAHQDHKAGLPHERRAAGGRAGALAGRDDPRRRELLAARRERDPLAPRGEALVGPGPARERARRRASAPLRRRRPRWRLRRLDDPVLHVRREPPRAVVAARPLDVARPAPERVRGRARARSFRPGSRCERAGARARRRLRHGWCSDRARRSHPRLRGDAERRPPAAAGSTRTASSGSICPPFPPCE